MNRIMPYSLAVVAALALGARQPALAQAGPAAATYVEEMPLLQAAPGTRIRGGQEGTQAVIIQNVRYPAEALRAHAQGTVGVRFTVTAAKQITAVTITKGLTAILDTAVVEAIHQLVVFSPARHQGQDVAVCCTVELHLQPDPADPAVALVQPKPETEYTFCEKRPALPGGSDEAAVINALRQRLVLPDAQAGIVYVTFTVTATGAISYPYIRRGLSPGTDAAVLAAVRQLPTFVPAQQHGQAVAYRYTLGLPIGASGQRKRAN